MRLSLEAAPERSLPGRDGNILLLILINLVDNALEASQAGDAVSLTFQCDGVDLAIYRAEASKRSGWREWLGKVT